MLKRSRISASGRDVERASRGSTIASVMSSCISISGRIHAKGAKRTLRAWTHSTGIVRFFTTFLSYEMN